jgi:hypothetical protein
MDVLAVILLLSVATGACFVYLEAAVSNKRIKPPSLLSPATPTATLGTTSITDFPYIPTCDNDLGHSPLRLANSSSRAHPDGTVTYCWVLLALAAGTQCETVPRGTCCQQDLTAVYVEISEAGKGEGP